MADIIDTQAGDASWTDTFYSLNRGNVDTELQRLDANHFNVWLPLTGQVAPTHILDQLNQTSSPRVADVATGTGVRLRSVSQHLRSDAELFGFDFDAVKFPDTTVSSNIKFKQQDVLQEFSMELQETFDLVHVRLLLIAMKASDFEAATKNYSSYSNLADGLFGTRSLPCLSDQFRPARLLRSSQGSRSCSPSSMDKTQGASPP